MEHMACVCHVVPTYSCGAGIRCRGRDCAPPTHLVLPTGECFTCGASAAVADVGDIRWITPNLTHFTGSVSVCGTPARAILVIGVTPPLIEIAIVAVLVATVFLLLVLLGLGPLGYP